MTSKGLDHSQIRWLDRSSLRWAPTFVGATWLILASLGTPPVGASAKEVGPAEVDATPAKLASFFLETITVEGERWVRPELILVEAGLETGGTYSEADLRAAVLRVNRLPFILTTDFSLRRGSARERYELLITVEETRPFFFHTDLLHTELGTDLRLADAEPLAQNFRVSQRVGMRFPVGNYGLLAATVSNREGVGVSYTRYQLFGRRALLHLNLARVGCCPVSTYPLGLDPDLDSWTSEGTTHLATLALGVPVGRESQLRIDASYRETASGERQPAVVTRGGPEGESARGFAHRRELHCELAWQRDSTDDPWFPTRGLALAVSLDYRWLSADLNPRAMGLADLPWDARQMRAVVNASQNWSIGERQALAVQARLAVGRSTVENLHPGRARTDFDLLESSVTVEHAFALWSRATRRRMGGDLRWENRVTLTYDRASPAFERPFQPLTSVRTTSALLWQSPWGIVQLGLSYLELGDLL